jgi:hypothetical protein
MSEKKSTTTTSAPGLFEKQNLLLMLIGAVAIAIGMILMAGGKSNDPTDFKYEEVYSFMRITVAPILIIAGLGIEIYAIFKKPKS